MSKISNKIVSIAVLLMVYFSASICFSAQGNIDNQNGINLQDAIMALQICSGMSIINVDSNADIDKDNKIGLAEAIYALQVSAGLRVPVFFSSDSDNPIQIDLTPIEYDESNQSIQAVLPDGNIVDMTKNKVEVREEDDYTWIGKIDGNGIGDTVMTVTDGVMFGRIDADGESYSVYPDGDNYKVMKNDSASIAPHGNDALVPDASLKKRFSQYSPRSGNNEDGSRIDILVLYTAQMQTKYGAAISGLIQHFVDLTNTSFQNSGITTQLRLVHSQQYNHTDTKEGTDIHDALNHITKSSDTINNLRDTHKADLVCLLRIHSGGNVPCGLAWVMGSSWVSPAFESAAFSVIEVRPISEANPYYCSELTFAHELGHNFGCAHDRDHANIGGAYDYSYGYDILNTFATVMSYDWPEIMYFSTPEVDYKGYPIGKDIDNTDSAYNALTINNTKSIVANFRVATYVDISGYVYSANDPPIKESGIELTFSNGGGSVVTDDSGYYTKSLPYGWTGTATAKNINYPDLDSFISPQMRFYRNVTSDMTDQDFVTPPHKIPPVIPPGPIF